MKFRTTTLISLVFLFLLRPTGVLAYNRRSLQIENITVTIVSDSIIAENKLIATAEKINRIAQKEMKKLCDTLYLRPALTVRFTICEGSWIFKQVSGYSQYNSGAYSCNSQEIFLQRVEALEKRRPLYLDTVMRHEMLHMLIDYNRASTLNNTVTIEGEQRIIEEALCESLFPTADGAKTPVLFTKSTAPKTYHAFIAYYAPLLQSSEKSESQQAYYTTTLWGHYLLQRYGAPQLCDMAIDPKKRTNLTQHYAQFLQTLP